jgi:DNA repair protein RecN (Recombination protein N)
MLLELRIRDFAVIRDLSMELGPGLNVLTGETGAGKSILIGALSLLLGERALSETVRAGADRATIEGVFDLSAHPELLARLEEFGFPREGEFLILRREVQAEGRNRAWINGSPATAAAVGAFGRALVDMHGQHEHQTLLHPEEQREILDRFAEAGELATEVGRRHRTLAELQEERAHREERRRELETRADFLRFQLNEISEAAPRAGEDQEAERELSRLDHAEELVRKAGEAHALLYGSEGSASEQVAAARALLRRLAEVDPSLGQLAEDVDTAYHQVTEAGRTLGSYSSGVEMDPRRAESLRSRLHLLSRLKRKYGPDLADVLKTRDRLRSELDELDGGSLALDELERGIALAREALTEAARGLSELRATAAHAMAREVEEVLPELGFDGAVMEVALEPLDEPGPRGFERVAFLASLNPGFAPRPLSRIASGGELSRVMLALKSILSRADRVPTLVFDEIDAGIGGQVANAVAAKLSEVAGSRQVLVITHLAQVASLGARHLRVVKVTEDGVAAADVSPLEGEERVREIARMLGGDPESSASREHAKELLGSR